MKRKQSKQLIQLGVTVALVIGLSVGTIFFSRRQSLELVGKAAATPVNFDVISTHPQFWKRGNEQYVGKRYLGTKANAGVPFLKSWSGPIDCNNSDQRQVVYQKYSGADDEKDFGLVTGWERWNRTNGFGQTTAYGGDRRFPVDSDPAKDEPFYKSNVNQSCWWMQNYRASRNILTPSVSQCINGREVPGQNWPTIPAGQDTASLRLPPNCSDPANSALLEVYIRDNFGPKSNQALRKQKCSQYLIEPIWGVSSNPYNMCLNADNAGYFEQRYAYKNGNFNDGSTRFAMGCEPLVYIWGYPESGATNKFFRNGELRYQTYMTVKRDATAADLANGSVWKSVCDLVWNDPNNGGWMYSGIYQIGGSFYEDKGTEAAPVVVTVPKPTPAPWRKTDIWKGSYGFSGENWLPTNNVTGDTGWVAGPPVYTTCPAGKQLVNQGTFYARWDGIKRFSGRSYCQ